MSPVAVHPCLENEIGSDGAWDGALNRLHSSLSGWAGKPNRNFSVDALPGGFRFMKPSRRPSSAIPEPGSPKPARRIVRLLLWGQFLALLAVLVLTQSGAMDSSWIPAWLGPGDAGHLDPLAMAVETRNLAELERLLDAHGDRIDVFDGDRMNPLLRAAAGGWIAGC